MTRLATIATWRWRFDNRRAHTNTPPVTKAETITVTADQGDRPCNAHADAAR
jgi:hypothetical protein